MPPGREHSVVLSTVSRERQKRKVPNKFSQDHQEEDSLLLRTDKKILKGKKKKKNAKHPLSWVKSDIIHMMRGG